MLLQHHGASLLGKLVPRSLISVVASFPGPFSPAADVVGPVVLTKSPPEMVRNIHRGQSHTWNRSQGILFGHIPLPSDAIAPMALSKVSTSNSERDLSVMPRTADACLLKSSPESLSSHPNHTQLPPQSMTSLDSRNAPSNASQESLVGNFGQQYANETNLEVREEDRGETCRALAFQIPQHILQKAKDAAPGTKDSFWSYKMYLGPDNQEVRVHYCRSKNTAERVAQYFLNETVIGFDIEWKPEATKNSGIKNNVALIQLACENRIALFHIAAFPKDAVSDLVAPTMKKIMEDADITKVGVAIKADCTRLRNYLKIDPKGILELSHLYKLVKYSSSGDEDKINKRLVSLTTQVEEHLELPIFKGEVRGSDWTQSLSIDQIKYAASDSYANFMLYNALERKRQKLRPAPPRPYHAELNLPIRLASGAVIASTDDLVDAIEPKKRSVAAASAIPASIIEAAAENIEVEDNTDQSITSSTPRPKPKPKSTDSSGPSIIPPKPQSLIDAESWVLTHHTAKFSASPSSNSPPTVASSALRVYALWYHNPSLSIPDIASMLRDPPLRNSTVAAYILESIRIEKLPFEKERLQKVVQVIPGNRGMWRYRGLWKLVD